MSSVTEEAPNVPFPGRKLLVSRSDDALHRFPALHQIFEDTAKRFALGVQRASAGSFDASLKKISAFRIGDESFELPKPCLVSVYDTEALRSAIAVVVDENMALSVVDALYGSKGPLLLNKPSNSLTKIQIRAGEFAIGCLIEAFGEAFSSMVGAELAPSHANSILEWNAIGRKGSIVIVAQYVVTACGREADAFVFIPRPALDLHRDALSIRARGKKGGDDSEWSGRLTQQVVQTTVEVSAVLQKQGLTLGDVANFKVGQLILLPIAPTDCIPLECEGRRLFDCSLGQKDGFYTVRVEEFVDSKEEFLNTILGE